MFSMTDKAVVVGKEVSRKTLDTAESTMEVVITAFLERLAKSQPD